MTSLSFPRNFRHSLNFESEPFRLSHLLRGHTGCVNTLHWSQQGDMLVSGSDDTRLMVWDARPGAAFHRQAQLRSGHADNIFDAKFAPGMEHERIVSVARDGKACIFDGWSQQKVHRDETDCSKTISFSEDTLKTVEFFDNSPHVFGICSEDGNVYQYDCRDASQATILELSEYQVSLYSMSACPSKPELVAVCGSDPFIRFYDRRKIRSAEDTCYCWTPPVSNRPRVTFFTGVRFSRFTYDIATYGINRKPYVLNPIFQCDEEMPIEESDQNEESLTDVQSWSNQKTLHAREAYNEALTLLQPQIARHLRMRAHPLWKEIFLVELYNRALLTGLVNKASGALFSMRADLDVIVREEARPPAHVKYLLLMVTLMMGHYDEFAALCDRFSDFNDDTEGLDFKIFKDILAVCEIDPAQIPNLIPNSIVQVCQQLPFISVNELPAVQKLKSKKAGNFEGYLGCFEKSHSRRTYKGVGFAGDQDQYVAVGCDGGHAFLYQNPASFGREYQKNPVWAAIGDSQITNVVEGHPFRPLIATSGLDHSIKVFEPSSYASNLVGIDENDLLTFKTITGTDLDNLENMDEAIHDEIIIVFG